MSFELTARLVYGASLHAVACRRLATQAKPVISSGIQRSRLLTGRLRQQGLATVVGQTRPTTIGKTIESVRQLHSLRPNPSSSVLVKHGIVNNTTKRGIGRRSTLGRECHDTRSIQMHSRLLSSLIAPSRLKTMSSSPATHKGDIKLRCTEFDHTGNVKTTAGEFSKHQLCVGNGLQPRDLRKIDSNFVNQLPAILVRDEVILVNLGHIRALIRADLVILFDTYGSTDSFHQSTFIYDLQEKLRNPGGTYGSLPFEFRAMESILISVVSSLQSEMDVLSGLVTNLLAHLEEHIDRDKLKELLQYSKRLARFEQKTLNIRDAVLEVLEEDEDLTEMCLTSKKNNRENINDYHEDIELLMETYLKQIEEIANVASSLTANMRTTEDIVNIMLDSQRNSLLLFELRLAMVTMGLTGGAFIASIFGMNLLSTLENNPYAFFVVSGTAVAAASFAFTLAMRRMRLLVKQS